MALEMTRKKIVIIVLCLIVVAVLLAYVVLGVLMNNATTLYLDPQTTSYKVGQDFSINVRVSRVSDLYGWEINLNWTASILHAVNMTEGSFLKSGGQTFFHYNNVTAGQLTVVDTLEYNVNGVNGSGVLATIQFHVVGSGECKLNLYETTLLTPSENSIGHVVKSGEFSTSI